MPGQQKIPICYINLSHRTDRRRLMEEQFSRFGLAAQRIEAATPQTIEDSVVRAAQRSGTIVSPQLACTASHQLAWKAIAESGAPAGLVLEDDAVLSPGIMPLLTQDWPATPAADIIRIERPARKLLLGRTEKLGAIPMRQLLSNTAGAGSYIITAETARKLIDHPLLTTEAVDKFLFGREGPCLFYMAVWQSVPALCEPVRAEDGTAVVSDLIPWRRGNRRGPKSLATRLRRAGNNLRYFWPTFAHIVFRQNAALHLERRDVPFMGR